ncbi:MAG: hypothetical protein K9H14_08245, partial [Actinomycetia bacterium]|nr:hypothetical protein [Actinomycetes bacterium]
MSIFRKLSTIVALIVAVAMVVTVFAGCSQQAAPAEETAQEAPAEEEMAEEPAEEEPAEEMTEEPAEEEAAGPKEGGTMRMYIHEPVSLDPPNSYESEGIQVIRQIWDGLFEYNPETLEAE